MKGAMPKRWPLLVPIYRMPALSVVVSGTEDIFTNRRFLFRTMRLPSSVLLFLPHRLPENLNPVARYNILLQRKFFDGKDISTKVLYVPSAVAEVCEMMTPARH